MSGVGWGIDDTIALAAGVYSCRAQVSGNTYLTSSGELRGAVAVFAIYADGSVVRLIDGERGANLSGTASVRVRGGVYSVDANVEDGARWELACTRR